MLFVITVGIVLAVESMPVAIALSISIYFAYSILSYYLLKVSNLWVGIVIPLGLAVFAFLIDGNY